jgi:hypothetical protein
MGEMRADAIRRALLIINLLKENSRIWGKKIEEELHRRDIQTNSFFFDGAGDLKPEGDYDCCFSLGGDGTVLYAARTMAPMGVPIFPINLGSLGFIASVHPAIRRPESAPPHRGGHLVLITAADAQSVTFHNPSGDSPATRERVQLSLNRFAPFFAGRGIAIA